MSIYQMLLDRVTSLTNRLNSIETGAKRSSELPAQTEIDLSSIVRVQRGNTSETLTVEQIVNEAIASSQVFMNRFVTVGEFTLEDQTLTIHAGWEWMINGQTYTNDSDVVIELELSDEGLTRIALIAATSLPGNPFVLINGGPSETNPVAPPLPANMLAATFLTITDDGVSQPEYPGVGIYDFVEKKTFGLVNIDATGSVDAWPIASGRLTLVFTGAVTSFQSLVPSSATGAIFDGARLLLINAQSVDFAVPHQGGSGPIKFTNPGNASFTVKAGKHVECVFMATEDGFTIIPLLREAGGDPGIAEVKSRWIVVPMEDMPVVNIAEVTEEMIDDWYAANAAGIDKQPNENLYFAISYGEYTYPPASRTLIYCDTTPLASAHTGTTALTLIKTYPVPDLPEDCLLVMKFRYRKTGDNSTVEVSGDFFPSGGDAAINSFINEAGDLQMTVEKTFRIRGGNISFSTASGPSAGASDYGVRTRVSNPFPMVSRELRVYGQLANAANTLQIDFITFEVITP